MPDATGIEFNPGDAQPPKPGDAQPAQPPKPGDAPSTQPAKPGDAPPAQPGGARSAGVLDANQIQALIPHRYPFLLVDRIIELEPARRIVGIKQVSLTDPYLQGHFPDYPVMPGVLIVEALAQAGAVLVLHHPANTGRMPFFARIDHCRFRQQVRPGDTLRLEVDVTSLRGPVGKAHARALVDGTLVCEADLTFALGTADSA